MAVTKILARRSGLKQALTYVMNGEKTTEQLLVATHLCTQENAYEDMVSTKQKFGKMDGVQCYHLIQSFQPGESTPELALEIAQALVQAHFPDHEAVIAVHVDKAHIHAHTVINSVNWSTGKKYHSNRQSYQQIRDTSDRLCREHGLSVISDDHGKAVSYAEWLRQSKGYPTFRSMLEADLKVAMEEANDFGHFLMLMEHMGYEVKHGSRLGFRLRGQAHFICPERKNSLYSEDGIRRYIDGNWDAIEAGLKPAVTYRTPYRPYKRHPKYTGFLALYVHYLYVLGKIKKQQYPPKMTPHMKAEVMKFERYREQFKFLREHGIETEAEMQAFHAGLEDRLSSLTKQRTILNVQKKRKKNLFDALADKDALSNAPPGTVDHTKFEAASNLLDHCGISREALSTQKSELYTEIADINRDIRQVRKQIKMCREIIHAESQMAQDIHAIERPTKDRSRQRQR